MAGKLDWRLKAMVLLGGDAGLRSGELTALEWPLHIPGRPSGKLVIVEVSQPWTGSRQGEKK